MSADIQLEDLVDLYDDLTRATDEVRRIIETLTGSRCIEAPTGAPIDADRRSHAISGHGIASRSGRLAVSRSMSTRSFAHQDMQQGGQHSSIQSLVESLSGLMSQQQIAKLIGVSRYTISNMLQDIRANQPPGRRKSSSFRLQGIGTNTSRSRG